MIDMEQVDVLIVGAGPGGLAAAKGAKDAGADRVIILERDSRAGGILNQCIHDGFGLVRYKKQLTGPEYALRAEQEAKAAGAELLTGHHVVRIEQNGGCCGAAAGGHKVVAISAAGLKLFEAGAIIMATGCRERTRGAIAIPGSRPAGVFTAGVVQNFVNIRNIMPGKRVVILGSGDVGMIMGRRLTLEGALVKAVIEILPQPAGLSRNVSQCLYDYGIPIYCSHTVSRIIGKKKLEAVEISALDDKGRIIKGTENVIECDALVLSVGLIPENEVAETAYVDLDAGTNGVLTDSFLQTNVPGIFSCGNSRKIMDLADFVSEQGELAGRNAIAYLRGEALSPWNESRSTPMPKGFPQAGVVTCTLCPKGCQIRFNEEIGEYEGNGCKRGIAFAEQERTNPKRMLTTTVKIVGGRNKLLPVRSKEYVSKKSMGDLVAGLQSITVTAPVRSGEEVAQIRDMNGEMITLISCSDESS